jgi:hypothetical protein
MNSKIYIGLITSNGQSKNLEELTSVYHYFDGIAATYHINEGEAVDDGHLILNVRKGNGFVVKREWYGDHSRSMNEFLLNPKIRLGDWILLRDSSERISIPFARQIKMFVKQLEANNIRTVYQYSKCLMFMKCEHQYFRGTPHWGLQGARGEAIAIENLQGFSRDEDYCYSTRVTNRSEDTFVAHVLRYYLYDSSNHLLLGRESKLEEFRAHDETRVRFKYYIEKELNIEPTEKGLLAYLKNNPLTNKLKDFINFEPILNDFYCYYILNHNIADVISRRNSNKMFFV